MTWVIGLPGFDFAIGIADMRITVEDERGNTSSPGDVYLQNLYRFAARLPPYSPLGPNPKDLPPCPGAAEGSKGYGELGGEGFRVGAANSRLRLTASSTTGRVSSERPRPQRMLEGGRTSVRETRQPHRGLPAPSGLSIATRAPLSLPLPASMSDPAQPSTNEWSAEDPLPVVGQEGLQLECRIDLYLDNPLE